ncbi:bifunctional DNA primase/polymerase [Brucella intermedia]|uniref:bifunctional DNA primase/polymerase n=1 Tax=Brucella intermedia TaxID=94625 RepID=UPI0018AA3F5E|nr:MULTISPECIES: bifunctional DNA primase/polymerase [Brucella/Ochrobactrum group]
MPDKIFGNEASKFWERKLPVIPVNGKAPIQFGWQGNLGGIPNEEKQRELVGAHPCKNIGMLLGTPVDGDKVLVAFDVDDDRLLKLTLQLLGLNRRQRRALSGKRGKKGATIFVRAPKSLKSTTIKGAGDLGNIDFLAAGKMTVMPPSIHPDTGKAYEVFGAPLLETAFTDLPEITEQHIKLLKAAIGSEYAIVILSGKATHDAGVAFTAALVSAGATDEEITDIFVGLLPDGYAGDSLKELPEWIKSAREKGFDELQRETNSLTKALVAIAMDNGVVLFNDGDGNAYATLPHLGKSVAVRLGSSIFSMWLRHLAHTVLERPISSGPLKEAVATLEAVALFEGTSVPVYVRVAGDTQQVVIDTGLPNGSIVKIDSSGWKVNFESDYRFVRGAGFVQLPAPEEGGNLAALQLFLGLDDQNYRLLVAFLINALKPTGPYFILLVEGEQGSGKSFFCEIVKRIIDPNRAMRLRLPDKPQDLMIQAKEYRLLNFDNASGMSAEMSDSLCSLATGGGLAVRRLYSDAELHVMSYSRPFVINGIGGYANRPDLMERAIPIKLAPMPEGGRKTEAELMAEFEKILPGILGSLYEAVAHALRTFDDTEPPRHLRMADAARWIKAAEGDTGEQPGALIDAIFVAQNEFMVERVNDDALVMMLRRIAEPLLYEGYIGDLYRRIVEQDDARHYRSLPKSPSHLSSQLIRMRPAMAKAGIKVEFLGKDRRGRKVRISLVDLIDPTEPQA